MATNLLENLLEELSVAINVSGLVPDKNNTCMLEMRSGLCVNIELDPDGKNLIIGANIGIVPAGKYRENLFKEALRSNGISAPRFGILGFSKAANSLIIFEKIPVEDLNGAKIANILEPLSIKADIWRTALARGEIPQINTTTKTTSPGSGMFGLKS